MQNQTEPTVKKEGVFFYLLLLTGFFILLEISFFIQCHRTYLYHFDFVASQLKIPASILPGIIFFLFAQLLVHIGYAVLIWVIIQPLAQLKIFSNKKILLAISLWTLGLTTILVANQYYFPNSKFAELTGLILVGRALTKIVFYGLLFLCLMVVSATVLSWQPRVLSKRSLRRISQFHGGPSPAKNSRGMLRTQKALLRMTVFMTGLLLLAWIFWQPKTTIDAAIKQPNIILIGIDSLRPDHLGYFGNPNDTPFLDSFLNQATVFSDAVTPLARTFPSWAAVLTGQHPRELNVRTNLNQQHGVDFSQSLGFILKQRGYETLYASDETRFSNIDKNFGFDRIISPPIGLNDFLLGTFNDFPISNLLVNTTIGKILFPYSYANRAAYFTYDPNSFLRLLKPALAQREQKPLFLAVHFCLPHYPYLWGSLPGNNFPIKERYIESLNRVDQQLRDFFGLLQQNNLLTSAIVVLLSDHGEALELPGDRITEKELFIASDNQKAIPKFYPPMLENEEVNQSAGHGTDVLGLPQYHALLAFRLYGPEAEKGQIIPGAVSLLSIKPTVLDLLQIDLPSNRSPSLAIWIKGKSTAIPQHHIFLESDYSPEAIRTVYPETQKVVLEGIELFQIDPLTTRLTVKDDMQKMIINSKQYADIYGEWMLALYPQDKNYQQVVLINLVSGKWTTDLSTSFAKEAPVAEMLSALKGFYGAEIKS